MVRERVPPFTNYNMTMLAARFQRQSVIWFLMEAKHMRNKQTIGKARIIGPVAAALLASAVMAAPAYARGMHTSGHMSGHVGGAPHFSGHPGGHWGGGHYAYRGGHRYYGGGNRWAFGWGGPYWDYPYYASDCYVRRVWRHHHRVWRRFCDY